jgi:hypothetical protein
MKSRLVGAKRDGRTDISKLIVDFYISVNDPTETFK